MNTKIPLAIKQSDSSVKIINDVNTIGYIHYWSTRLGKMILTNEVPLRLWTEVELSPGSFLSFKDNKGQLVPICGSELWRSLLIV